MPLFTSQRDAGFLLGVNKEIMHGFSSVEVAVYKIDIEQTDVNIYEESTSKAYRPPVRIFAQIRFDEKTTAGDELTDFTQTLGVGFLINDLKTAQLFIEEGDIIEYDSGFYQVDQISEPKGWAGRRPDAMIGISEDGWNSHGYDISVVAECHLTRTNNLNIVEVRKGIVETAIGTDTSIPNFL
jgi:hypothetical protein